MMRLQQAGISRARDFRTCLVAGACLIATCTIAAAQVPPVQVPPAQSLGAQPSPEPNQAEMGRQGSQPSSDRASNTGADMNAPQIAPALPLPPVDENASSEELLHVARSAIARGRTGEAQEAMERAQTRLLDRSVPLFKTNQPSTHPAIPLISEALHALGAGDRAAAMAYLDKAIPLAIPPKE